MERPTRSRKQPSQLADFEVSDSGRVVQGRGRRGGVDSVRAVRGRGRRGGVDGGVDVEVSGDSERAVRGRGRRGGRGLILNDVVVVLNRVSVPNQPIRPNALTIQTGNRI